MLQQLLRESSVIRIILQIYYFEHVMSRLQLLQYTITPKFCIHFNYLLSIATMCNYFENVTRNLKPKLILPIIIAEEFVFFCLNSLISGALSRILKIIFSFDGLILVESYWLFHI